MWVLKSYRIKTSTYTNYHACCKALDMEPGSRGIPQYTGNTELFSLFRDIHDPANEQYGKDTRNAQEWVLATFARLFHSRVAGVTAGVKRVKAKSNEERSGGGDCSGCAISIPSQRKKGLRAARRAGYHIVSGAIGSPNKFISHVRLKRSGAWWHDKNANNILKLRCAKYNEIYDKTMELYKQRDQEQNYAKFGSKQQA
jgi:hypothetical protein